MKKIRFNPIKSLVYIVVLSILTTACTAISPTSSPTISGTKELTVMVHDSFAASDEVIQDFEDEHQAKIVFLPSGDTGTALNKAILSKGNPLADVFYGVDNTFLSRALDEGIFDAYSSPVLTEIPEEFKLDSNNYALPVDYGDVCLNYDRAYFQEKGISPPMSLEDLSKPKYKSLLVVQNPATSSPGLAFLLTTIAQYGEDGYLDYWKKLKENDVLIVNDWETAYYTEFSGSSGKGPRPIVVSYDSSPAFEVIYAETPITEPSTAAIVTDGTCFRQTEFVGILKGGKNRELAEKWVDFMLTPKFQEDMPLQMFVFPVNPHAKLDEVFVKYLKLPEKTAYISPQAIAQNRERWLQTWTEAILR